MHSGEIGQMIFQELGIIDKNDTHETYLVFLYSTQERLGFECWNSYQLCAKTHGPELYDN